MKPSLVLKEIKRFKKKKADAKCNKGSGDLRE